MLMARTVIAPFHNYPIHEFLRDLGHFVYNFLENHFKHHTWLRLYSGMKGCYAHTITEQESKH